MNDAGHEHAHGDGGGPGAISGGVRWSPMLAGLPARLMLAGGLIAALWLVVGWSLRP